MSALLPPPPGWVRALVGDAYEGAPCAGCGAAVDRWDHPVFNEVARQWACSTGCAARLTARASSVAEARSAS